MIYGNIRDKNTYKDLTNIYTALCALEAAYNSDFPSERIVIDGDNLFINPLDTTTNEKSKCIFEAHKNYIDIHFSVCGSEAIGVRKTDELEVTQDYSADIDAVLLKGSEKALCILNPGDFLICYPEDAHMVCIAADNPMKIQKFVAKIKI